MDVGSKNKYPAGSLSNFSPHPFSFRGIPVTSMEGFLQGLKFKNPDMQRHIFTLVGFKAKKAGSKKNWHRDQILYYQGKPIKRASQEYQALLDEVYWELFKNKKARKALLASGKAVLTHSMGKNKKPDTVLTEQEFCSRLMRIRKRLEAENEKIPPL